MAPRKNTASGADDGDDKVQRDSTSDSAAIEFSPDALAQALLKAFKGVSASSKNARPHPDKLSDGKNPAFEDWLALMKDKFRFDAESYPTEEQRISYIRGRVEGKAASHLRPRLGDGAASPLATCDEIFDFLRSVFRDRNARRRAREQLDNLTLGRGAPFYEFHGEFVRLATEAGLALDEWKDRLEGKLSFRIRSATARAFNNDAVTFDEYVQEVSEQAYLVEQQVAKEKSNTPKAYGRPNTQRSSTTASTSKKTAGRAPRYEQETLANGTRRFKDPKIRKLAAEGKCFVCEKTGHNWYDCPRKDGAAVAETTARENTEGMSKKGKRAVIEGETDTEESDSDSGKADA